MKRIILALTAAALVCTAFTACTKKEKADYTIGIAKIVQHAALDAVEQGIQDQLEADGYKIRYDLQNANGDVGTAAQIAALFKSEKVDFAVGIATPTAVALAEAIKDRPVIYTSVTDPVEAKLVETVAAGKDNVTGLSDAIATEDNIRQFIELAGIKKLGYIYTSNEANSISALKEVRGRASARPQTRLALTACA